MGCLQSKKEISDLHPNVFRVVNIDENKVDLCSGQLEITDSDIILYREGRDSTVWPLHSLRRYGFEGEIFSFESGRRCETGEGIYAFRCRRASLIFQALQHQIHLRNVAHDSVPYPESRLTPSPQSRQTLQATVIHRSSVDNGQPENAGTGFNNNITINSTVTPAIIPSPHSPSSADILEVMPLYPRSQATGNHVTNVYQVRDFKRENNNNNQAEVHNDVRHVYTNDFNRDLAMLRKTLKQENILNTIRDIEDETRVLEQRHISELRTDLTNNILSPTISCSSEHYAQLSTEEACRMYVNIAPSSNNSVVDNKSDPIPTTPLTPKQVEYSNLTVAGQSVSGQLKLEINTYANVMLGDTRPMHSSEHNQKFSESDTFTSMSPVEEMEVNYAVLDIDTNKENTKVARELASPESQSYNSSKNESTASHTSQPRARVVSQTSIDRTTSNPINVPPASIGYTTIDFDKTVALTSVAAGAENNMDGSRKNRHNSCGILSGSPGSSEKSRGIN